MDAEREAKPQHCWIRTMCACCLCVCCRFSSRKEWSQQFVLAGHICRHTFYFSPTAWWLPASAIHNNHSLSVIMSCCWSYWKFLHTHITADTSAGTEPDSTLSLPHSKTTYWLRVASKWGTQLLTQHKHFSVVFVLSHRLSDWEDLLVFTAIFSIPGFL